MLTYIFSFSSLIFAIFFLTLSKSETNYKKLVDNNGEKFAKQVNKGLMVGGYLLLICSLIWLAIIFFDKASGQ